MVLQPGFLYSALFSFNYVSHCHPYLKKSYGFAVWVFFLSVSRHHLLLMFKPCLGSLLETPNLILEGPTVGNVISSFSSSCCLNCSSSCSEDCCWYLPHVELGASQSWVISNSDHRPCKQTERLDREKGREGNGRQFAFI